MKMHNKTKKGLKKGGLVIGSGGYGCVFRPALKCSHKTQREPNKITKLMKTSYALKEYGDIEKFRFLLKNIPDYSDYFLLEGTTICNPEALSHDDLKNFDKKCSPLKKIRITEENINQHLDQLKAVSMPYGGIDVGEYIFKTSLNYANMEQLTRSLIDLLNHGIIPMNSRNVYHGDIKESNILVQTRGRGLRRDAEIYTRLIDWGLSIHYPSNSEPIPAEMYRRPFQYNVPFSIVLFNPLFEEQIAAYIEQHPDMDGHSIREFVLTYIEKWIKEGGVGHMKELNVIFKKLHDITCSNERDELTTLGHNRVINRDINYPYVTDYIVEYISEIVVRFSSNGKFHMMEYFTTVYLKNVDVWGFVMTYAPIMEYIHYNLRNLNNDELQMACIIKDTILYMLSKSTSAIDPAIIVNKLEHLLLYFIKNAKTPYITVPETFALLKGSMTKILKAK